MQNSYAIILIIFGLGLLIREIFRYREWQYFLNEGVLLDSQVVAIERKNYSSRPNRNVRNEAVLEYHCQGYKRRFHSKFDVKMFNVQIGDQQKIHVIQHYPNLARTNLDIALKPVKIIGFATFGCLILTWGCFKLDFNQFGSNPQSWTIFEYAYAIIILGFVLIMSVCALRLFQSLQYSDPYDPQRRYKDNAGIVD
ncbi:hypothetical protein BS636_09525 [Acinetobacter sp. LoGeW2-3]|uniref:hypothetical protein n=1 Tax=Acinetobacter sp. LoGeW2-3 TaxID=1808001 RepID=UPI000C05AEB3|nr:hypothetical protein [Acinetobacter sp. LoGeW2-3]ATO19871.1 hypothetical protein BS636_09525 [Acinetobacter sp. LoGeW2-3]